MIRKQLYQKCTEIYYEPPPLVALDVEYNWMVLYMGRAVSSESISSVMLVMNWSRSCAELSEVSFRREI